MTPVPVLRSRASRSCRNAIEDFALTGSSVAVWTLTLAAACWFSYAAGSASSNPLWSGFLLLVAFVLGIAFTVTAILVAGSDHELRKAQRTYGGDLAKARRERDEARTRLDAALDQINHLCRRDRPAEATDAR